MLTEGRSSRSPSFYLPQLDGLRFIAFLLVFIHNAPHDDANTIWKSIHEYGWIGVDLFFCLSAFLITRLLVLEFNQNGKVNVQNFYFRRILRIWPLYFFYLLIATLFIIQDQGWSSNLANHLAGLVTFTYNFIYLSLTSKIYFVFVHLWTISYEEQFYALIPWTIDKLVNKKNTAMLFLIFIFLVGTAVRAILIFTQTKHPAIYMLPFTHFEAALCGVAIGAGFFNRLLGKIPSLALFTLGIALNSIIFFLPNTYEIGWGLMFTYPLVGIGMSLIIYSLITKGSWFSEIRFLKSKPLIFLGKRSYGLYIYHLICLSVLDKLFSENLTLYSPLFVTFSSLILTICLASLSYYYLEFFFLNIKERFKTISSASNMK